MSTPRFIIAKYVPELHRMEPRNIGLFLWNKGRVATKFLSEKEAGFINEMGVFQQWVEYWTDLVSREYIDVPGHEPVPTRSEDCLKAILSTQEGNYLLVDAGFVPTNIAVKDMPNAVNYLFGQLVAPVGQQLNESGDDRSPSLVSQCDAVLDRAGLSSRSDFKRNEAVEVPVFGVKRHLHASYYLGNGTPHAIFQRANLASEQSVSSGALMIRMLTDTAAISPDQCRFLVKRGESLSDSAAEGLALLEAICGAVDIDDDNAPEELRAVAALNGDTVEI